MSEGIVLTGLDASNPLAFLAAIGVVEALADAGLAPRLRFELRDAWRPVLEAQVVASIDALSAILEDDRMRCGHSQILHFEYQKKGKTGETEVKFARDLKAPPRAFRELLLTLCDELEPSLRRDVDWCAAFGDECAHEDDALRPPAFHFCAGPQQFLDQAAKIRAQASVAGLRQALAGWAYQDECPQMGWDATRSSDYALRGLDPGKAKGKLRGEVGAEWLAIRGLTALLSAGAGRTLKSTLCTRGYMQGGSFVWPLWDGALDRRCIRAVLRRDWQQVGSAERAARGVREVFACEMRRIGYYGCFDGSTSVDSALLAR